MGEEKLQALLQEGLAVATRTEAMKPSDLARVVVDTTVQPKAVTFPTDAKLLNRARERLVRLASKHGLELRQSYRRVGKLALIKHQRYAHAPGISREANGLLRDDVLDAETVTRLFSTSALSAPPGGWTRPEDAIKLGCV
jgi:transposase, IS5 family